MVADDGCARPGRISSMGLSEKERLGRFVRRARRIEAHSLVQDKQVLQGLLEDNIRAEIPEDGSDITLRMALPDNEEVFESLAARVRPLLVKSESIFYKDMLSLLERRIRAVRAPDAAELARLDELRQTWAALVPGDQVQVYEMRSEAADGTASSGPVPDALLADGWLYADLVHVDPQGRKQKTLGFGLQHRYAAGVKVFARVAWMTVATLRFVEELNEAGIVDVPEEAWTDEVVVGSTELVLRGSVYFAPVGTPFPDSLASPPGGPWQQVSTTRLPGRTATTPLRTELMREDGTLVATHDGVVLQKQRDGDLRLLRMQVTDGVHCDLRVRVRDDAGDVLEALEITSATGAPEDQLAAYNLQLEMHEANSLTFVVNGSALPRLSLSVTSDEATRSLRQRIELLDDLVTIGRLAGQTVGPFPRALTLPERVRVRQLRMLWEGRVPEWDRSIRPGIFPVENPGSWIRLPDLSVNLGGTDLPMPADVLVGHPEVNWRATKPTDDEQREGHVLEGTVPGDRRILAWSTSRRESQEEPCNGEEWNLSGVDQVNCTF